MPDEVNDLIDKRLTAFRKRCRDEQAVPVALIAMQRVDDHAQPIFFCIENFPQHELPGLLSEIAEEVRLLSVLRN